MSYAQTCWIRSQRRSKTQRPRNPKLLRPRLSPDDFPEATAQFFLHLFIFVCWSLSVFQFCILSRHCWHSVVSACLNCLDTRFAGPFFLTPNPISSTESFHRNLRSSLIFVFILSMSQGQPLDQQDLEFELEKQRLWDTT